MSDLIFMKSSYRNIDIIKRIKILAYRKKPFHIQVIQVCLVLPKNNAGYTIGKQLIRPADSFRANYQASKKTKSFADFMCKIEVVLKE